MAREIRRFIWLFALLLGLGIGDVACAQFPRTKRVCYEHSIPCANYQFRTRSTSTFKISESAIAFRKVVLPATLPSNGSNGSSKNVGLETIDTAENRPLSAVGGSNSVSESTTDKNFAQNLDGPKLFQFLAPKLVIDHCSVSKVAMWVDKEGNWSVNLTALQNDPEIVGQENSTLFTEHLKRNQFHLVLRMYGASATQPNDSSQVGLPQLAEISLEPFWVQRDQPFTLSRQGNLCSLKRHFHEIDRVELEFYFR